MLLVSLIFLAELPQCAMGEACIWNSCSKLGSCFGRFEQAQGVHWQQPVSIISACFTTANVADSLVALCVFQSCQRTRSHHWHVLEQTSVSRFVYSSKLIDDTVRKQEIAFYWPNKVTVLAEARILCAAYCYSYLNAIQTMCPHILRYLATAVIINRTRRSALKDLVKVIQQVRT